MPTVIGEQSLDVVGFFMMKSKDGLMATLEILELHDVLHTEM